MKMCNFPKHSIVKDRFNIICWHYYSHLDMSLRLHFRHSHIQVGRLGNQSWSGHQEGWQCTPYDDHDDSDADNYDDDEDAEDDDDDDDWAPSVGQVIRVVGNAQIGIL